MVHHQQLMPPQSHHYQPTPPYYGTEVFVTQKGFPQPSNDYLATPSSTFPVAAPHPHPHPHPHPPLAINTKVSSVAGPTSAPVLSTRKQQQQTVAQLASFASHMVCYMLYGHQSQSLSVPSSPLANTSHSLSGCNCPSCVDSNEYTDRYSTCSYSGSHPPPQPSRPTHSRIASEDKIQPKPMFRKFCLDVLSATLLSPSVILLSLKYIQKLMINLKSSNKIVNTGDGAEYRFFTGALILANKFLDDNTFTNKTWADITGMKIKDINHLEMQFLNGIDFKLFTSPAEYSEWLAGLTQFTSKYMPAQYPTAYQHQAAAAQSPISPVDPLATEPRPSSSGAVRDDASHPYQFPAPQQQQQQHQHPVVSGHADTGKPYCHTQHTQAPTSLSMASISHYIDSVKHLQQRTTTRYQRVPSQQSQLSLPPLAGFEGSFSASPTSYHHGQESLHRKRSANIAFDDPMDRSPYESTPTGFVPTHKRFSSASSASMFMGSTPSMFGAGHSPMESTSSHRMHRSQQSLSAPHRSRGSSRDHHHQRSASGSYYMDLAPTYSSSYGSIHPLETYESHRSSQPTHPATLSSQGTSRSSQIYYPSTPPHYSPMKPSCGGCAPTTPSSYEVDPRLWGPLDSISLYAITTQAAKRVVAQSKALSSSANGLHMYYPTLA
ncbi:hypothetical protein BGZ81_011585 [Podila clonocystis]|nr:hypothetical protein BGZ81_011585 [Podila clonocystis]